MSTPAISAVIDVATSTAVAVLPEVRAVAVVNTPTVTALAAGPQGPPGPGVLLLENGAAVPPGTPANTVIFEKA